MRIRALVAAAVLVASTSAIPLQKAPDTHRVPPKLPETAPPAELLDQQSEVESHESSKQPPPQVNVKNVNPMTEMMRELESESGPGDDNPSASADSPLPPPQVNMIALTGAPKKEAPMVKLVPEETKNDESKQSPKSQSMSPRSEAMMKMLMEMMKKAEQNHESPNNQNPVAPQLQNIPTKQDASLTLHHQATQATQATQAPALAAPHTEGSGMMETANNAAPLDVTSLLFAPDRPLLTNPPSVDAKTSKEVPPRIPETPAKVEVWMNNDLET